MNYDSVKSHLIKNSSELQMKLNLKKYHYLDNFPKFGKTLVTANIYF